MTFESNRFLHKKECREQTLKQVTVFNDRAELKRIISCNTNPGFNEIHIQNVTHYIVPDSVRVDGRGVGIIHSVEVQDKPATYEETDSPKLAQLRARYQEKLHEINVMKDREAILQKRIQALDKMVLEIGTNVCKTPNTREPFFPSKEALDSLTNFYNFYDESALAVRAEQRDLVNNIEKESRELDVLLLELNKMETDWNAHRQKKTIIVGVESDKGGLIELEVSYQIYGARWYPSYDIRVKTSSNSLTISYFGNISQSTGEDWSNSTLVKTYFFISLEKLIFITIIYIDIYDKKLKIFLPKVLSSAQPCHGDQIPDLGALEAVFYRPSPSPRAITHYKAKTSAYSSSAFSQSFQDSDALCLSSLEHAVTIGIVDVIPQLIHQCVPSKNTNVFLIAYATNTSSFPFLRGDAAVYLNHSFVGKTNMKNVSPGETFSCSLGVDVGVHLDYKPVKKYHEQVGAGKVLFIDFAHLINPGKYVQIGLINKYSSTAYEQIIVIKNAHNEPVLVTVKEHIPRSTDERIKIRLIAPAVSCADIQNDNDDTISSVQFPKEGFKFDGSILDWTIPIQNGKSVELHIKWAMEHPRNETVHFVERN
ncbi:hypothetical protein DICVIV_03770 [Dictyocaulus viviparus]|uniref:DUF4139 domain-containing protein n=1 Tax=Dictyocaulus viviparus TaxID=29172 RepID=A0A0D8Y1X3_DICVI|nr:hypothetical protein DICVIV_03770 [Dictyocaulus viviparus]